MLKIEKRQFTAEYKARIFFEVLKESGTISEIAARKKHKLDAVTKLEERIHRKYGIGVFAKKIECEVKREIRKTLVLYGFSTAINNRKMNP